MHELVGCLSMVLSLEDRHTEGVVCVICKAEGVVGHEARSSIAPPHVPLPQLRAVLSCFLFIVLLAS